MLFLKKSKVAVIFLILILLVAGTVFLARSYFEIDLSQNQQAQTQENTIEKTQKEVLQPSLVQVEIAKTPQQQRLGLMHRSSLCKDCGMLFEFSRPRVLSFWMKNVQFPIDIVFLDSSGLVVAVFENVEEDNDDLRYVSPKPAQYALEVNANQAKSLGIETGKTVDLDFLQSLGVEFGTGANYLPGFNSNSVS